ncbi:hypothetical protein D9Q98_006511 [Chlorella vulgaris]|uniref:Uncharacterized protein n=1 Tax=Chlorella vulgaris TaxID=3077 RepID=A0A9D4YV51_CHLVU|nr:hypothetical protein D9Q98_006511 [Chlorella vulgaris]
MLASRLSTRPSPFESGLAPTVHRAAVSRPLRVALTQSVPSLQRSRMQRSCRNPPPCAADSSTSEPLFSSEYVEMQRQAEQTFNAAQGEMRALEDRVNTTAGPKSQSRTVESPNGCYWQPNGEEGAGRR